MRGKESSGWGRLSGVHFDGFLVASVCGFGGVNGGSEGGVDGDVSLGFFIGEEELFSVDFLLVLLPPPEKKGIGRVNKRETI